MRVRYSDARRILTRSIDDPQRGAPGQPFGQLLRGLALLFLLVSPAPLAAQQTGRVTGVAVEAVTGQPLRGAAVVIDGTALAVATDQAGRFVFARVPAGARTIRLSSLGYEPQNQQVTVRAGESAEVRFEVRAAAFVLNGLTVLGARAMVQAEALQRQNSAPNIMNVVASDQMGRFPDASAPEAVARIPGVAIARDQGEGRYIQIRGGSAANTQVTFNGVEIPSPEGEVRQIALDAVPADLLGSIEVSKAILPSMDADAIGGAVNLVTLKAPASRLMSLELAGGFAQLREKPSGSGALTYGDRTADGRLGFLVSGSYSRRDFGSDDVEPEYDLGDAGKGDDALEELQVRHYSLWRERTGATANVDYQLGEASTLNFTGVYSNMTDQEQRRILGSIVEDGELEYRHKNRQEELRTYSLALGGQHLLRGGLQIDYTGSYTRSVEDTPFDVEATFLNEGVTFAPDISDPDRVVSNPSAGSLNGPFLFDDIEPASSDTRNTDRVGSLDLSLPLAFGNTVGRLKFGAKFRSKEKTQDVIESAYEQDGGSPIVLGEQVGSQGGFSINNPATYQLASAGTSPDDVRSFVDRFDSQLDGGAVIEEDVNDYDLDERVVAGYVMAELNLSSTFLLLPGVRYEQTKVDARGHEWDSETEALSAANSDASYGNLFPMLHARWAVGPRTNVRAAFTTAIARPNFFDLVPYRIRDDEDLEIGNPDLDPTMSRGVDLLLEHYDSRIGVLSAGVFYKRLQNPIFVFTESNQLGGDTEQPRNGENGTIRGVELAFVHRLAFLPAPFDGLSLYTNYTYTDSDATLPSGREARLQGQADHVFNVALGYERAGFSTQASANYHDNYVDEYADDEFEDVYIDSRLQLDVSASQRVTGKGSVFVELINLTNAPLLAYVGTPDRPIQQEYYESWGRLGFRINW